MKSEEAQKIFDQYAGAYRDWWGPIIEPPAARLLERVSPPAGGGTSFDLLDVGTGTGALALAALERWPGAHVTGIDPSSVMLEVAGARATERWSTTPERLRLVVGTADKLPMAPGSMDVVVSSFVIQLVPERAAMLGEIRRVLRPGGIVACLTWLEDEVVFEPDDLFDDIIHELRIDRPIVERDVHPYSSVKAAEREFRAAGFSEVAARPEWLEHRFKPKSYLGLLEHWIERELFAGLDAPRRRDLRAAILHRMRELGPSAFVYRRPLVSVTGVAPSPV